MKLTRRACLQGMATGIVLGGLHAPLMPLPAFGAPSGKPALFYETLEDGRIHCLLCPNGCVTRQGELGRCKTRKNLGRVYQALTYNTPCVLSIDPPAKFPLFHYQIKGNAFSIATAGCNLSCQYCQNWQFSQSRVEDTRNFTLNAATVVAKAKKHGAGAIGFFYTEPIIYFEYMLDIATQARRAGLKTIMVTGGYINREPLEMLFPLIDAFVVGLKGFTEEYYRTIIGGSLEPVKKTLARIAASGRHLEVVTLLVPTLNDDGDTLKSLAAWYVKHVGADVPWHVTRFTPQYQLKGLPPTPVAVLENARAIGRGAGIRFVYTGNIPGHEGNHTLCPSCGTMLIERLGFQEVAAHLVNGACPRCGARIPGFWLSSS